ncbi:hypothetical protein LT85_1656 [Collimonas arenae]|uniref:Uncharacterized protein n=1 Tax=Collimonas arenae TaxID=279058 RepID=A0A0A1FAZ0_9BURK|nr:hypothetical protein LT85_1656 [Collimonas arenae]
MGISDSASAALLKEPGKAEATPAPRRLPKPSFLMNYTRPTYPGRVSVSYFWILNLPQGRTLKVRVG